MHRNKLRDLLISYKPTIDEMAFKTIMLDFIEKYSQCFDRSLTIGHITASSWLVNKENTKALLTHHAKLDRWLQLGGHCDGNSDVLAVAIKEAQEESGIYCIEPLSDQIFDIDIHLIPTYKDEPAHFHLDIRFLLQVKSNEYVTKSHESKALRWIAKDATALPTKDPSVVRLFNKWLAL